MRNSRAKSLALAIDIGSSSTRTALFDQSGRRLAFTTASEHYSIRYTSDGGADLSPLILRRAAERCIAVTLRNRRDSRALKRIPISAVGGSAFWHGLLGLDRQGRPITPVFTWADSRAAADAATLRGKISEKKVHARTGCMLRATFWPAKLLWLRRTEPKTFRRVAVWVSPVDWIFRELFSLTGTSASMASATGLYNLWQRDWDDELCAICGIDARKLAPILDRAKDPPTGRRDLVHARIFPAIGDGAAGNLGSGADQPGIAAINVGTSAAVRMIQTTSESAKTRLPFGLFRYVVDSGRVVMGGAVSNAGNLREWCLRELRLARGLAIDNRVFNRAAAAQDILTVLPFWVSERAPTWPEQQHGVIDGLNQATTATQMIRAITCSVFYRLADILDLMEGATQHYRRIIVSGGILQSSAEIRLLADAIGRDVQVAWEAEASLRGAAIHAWRELGFEVKSRPAGRMVRCHKELAAKHRKRRQRQRDLESLLEQGRR
jgi:gluconokinase